LHFLQHVKSHRVIKTSVFQTNLGRNIENISCANRQVVKSSAKTGQDIHLVFYIDFFIEKKKKNIQPKQTYRFSKLYNSFFYYAYKQTKMTIIAHSIQICICYKI